MAPNRSRGISPCFTPEPRRRDGNYAPDLGRLVKPLLRQARFVGDKADFGQSLEVLSDSLHRNGNYVGELKVVREEQATGADLPLDFQIRDGREIEQDLSASEDLGPVVVKKPEVANLFRLRPAGLGIGAS